MKKSLFPNRLFDEEFQTKIESKYSSKITTPIYEPKQKVSPKLFELCDKRKTCKLIRQINQSNISDNEKEFLISAAQRHLVFNYDKIAEYYCHASKEMQELMESSALVIIDFHKAIEGGYIKLSKEIAQAYLNEYGEDK